jgi:5-formyltetrahydrofolate cyclo-ligase
MKNSDITSEKSRIRKAMQDKRWAMAEILRGKAAQTIMKRVLGLQAVQDAVHIFCYVSRPPEVDTWELIAALLDRGKEIYCPRMLPGDTMEAVRIDDLTDLKRGKYGIYEPLENQGTAEASELDLALVPGLAFDREGMRLGYGKGYYDRFFSGENDIIKVGLAYGYQLVADLPALPDDIGMDIIVTESEILNM